MVLELTDPTTSTNEDIFSEDLTPTDTIKARRVVEALRAQKIVNGDASYTDLSEELRSFIRASRRTIASSLEKLSLDIYSDPSRTLFELIQNAGTCYGATSACHVSAAGAT